MNKVRHNPFAIVVASFLYFALGGVWFTVFKQAWMNGIGRTQEELMATGVSPAISYSIAIITTIILAIFLSWLIQISGLQTLAHGVKVAFLAWFGFIFTTWAAEYAFEVRTIKTFAITAGYSLTGMLLMGVVLGSWKKKGAS
jgi:hypothetical protein